LAEKINRELQEKPDLIKSMGGVFEVKADGNLIYSKKVTGVFPDENAVIDSLRRLKSAG